MSEYIDDLKQKEIEAQKKDNLKWLYPISAGLGAIALGSFIYKTTFAGQGGNVVANLLHFLGRPNQVATNVDKIANTGASEASSNASGIRSWLTSTFNLKTKEVQLGPVDLITELGSSLEILGNRRGPIQDKLTERFTEHINRRFANRGNNTSFFSQNLQRITVEEVLGEAGKKQWADLLGKDQWNVLKRGHEWGLVKGNQELDRFLFKTNKGFLRDVRPGHFIDRMLDVVPFGQGGVFKSLLGERQGVALLKNTTQVKGDSYYIGGNVYAYTKDPKKYKGFKETLVATNQKLRKIGDRLEPIRAAKEGRIEYDLKLRSGKIGQAVTAFERTTGVGTSFQNRYSFLQRWVTNPIKRLSGLASGKAIIRESTVEKTKGTSTWIDEVLGANYPEVVRIGPRAKVAIGQQVAFADLSIYQKFMTITNRSDKYSLTTTVASEKFDRVLKGGVKPHADSADFFTAPPPTGGIKIKNNISSGFYTAPRSRVLPFGTSVRDLASYLVYRTSHLASESLLGISFAPAKTLLGNAARLAAVPLVYETGRQLYNYADYLTESATGISPTKLLASAYASARVFQQQVREATGIQQASAAAENNYPGSVNSGLGYLLRSAVAPMGVFAALAKTGRIGAAIAGAVGTFAAIGGSSPDQTSESLQQEYDGKIKIPIRKGRFWGLGNTPFEGGEIERFDYSWYHKLMKDPKTKSIYGSQEEYYRYHANVFGVPLPTPSNLFGLRNILNPYRLETLNQNTRPYEQSGSGLEEFPIFGPMLASTIGKVLKPTLFRAGVIPEGLNQQTARDLGLPDIVASEPDFNSPVDRVQKMANVALEPLGVYKFAMEYFGLRLEPKTEQLATSNLIDSPGKNFYAMNLGGGFSNTEFIRRFLMSDYSSTSNLSRLVNRVPNSSPDWLPGQRCLKPDSIVDLIDGNHKFAGDIKIGDKLVDIDGNISNVTNTIVREMNPNEKAYTISLAGDLEISNIVVTEEHPILVTRYDATRLDRKNNRKIVRRLSKPEWKFPKDISKSDFVCVPLLKDKQSEMVDLSNYCSHDKVTSNWIYRSSSPWPEKLEYLRGEASSITKIRTSTYDIDKYLTKTAFKDIERIPRYVLIDDIAFLLGSFISDGSEKNSSMDFYPGKNELGFINRILTDSKNISYCPATSSIKGEVEIISVYNSELTKLFSTESGKYTKDKSLPWFLINKMSLNGIRNLLIGLYAGDGCVTEKIRKGGRVSSWNLCYKTASINLANDIRKLWLKIGLQACVYSGFSSHPDDRSKKCIYYSVVISAIDTFDKDFCFEIFKYKDYILDFSKIERRHSPSNKWTSDGRYTYVQIKSIKESTYHDVVIGITTDNTHTFCVNKFVTHNSRFDKDRDYYVDYHMGNPFDKIAGGEARLPGPGYEAVAELESGKAGEYSPVDRLLILADVAPWSEAYAAYDKEVMGMKLSPEWQQKVDLAREYKKRSTSIENRYPRYADSLIALNEHIHDSAAYKDTRKAYDFLTHDILAEIPLLGSKLAPFRDPYEKYRKQFVEGSEFASWYTPWEDIQRPALTDIALSNPIMGAVKGGALGYLLSSPMFLGFASPIAIGGKMSITAGAIAGGTLSAGRLALGVPDNYVPDSVIEQSETIQYLDALQYTKSRAYELMAQEQGLNSREITNQKRKTLVGANTQIMLRASLPTSSDKKYFDVFLNTPGPNREELLAGVAPHMSYALTKAWSNGYGSDDSRDQEAMERLEDQQVPAFDSLAWHPSVDNKSMGLKIVSHGLNGTSDNYHKYGFYESHEATLRSRLPDLWNESTTFTQPPKYFSGRDYMQNIAQNIGGSRTSMFSTPFGARYTQRLQIDRSNETLDAVRGR